MSQHIRILYIGPKQSETFDTSSLEQQSRAIKGAGLVGRAETITDFTTETNHSVE